MKYLTICLVFTSLTGFAEITTETRTRIEYRDSQEVDFDGADIDGTVRRPEGSYLLQKGQVNFVPIYQVREGFDERIKESHHYLR